MESNRHSAAGPAAGFAYQFERALNWLAKKDAGACIGIETDDDIAVRNSDSTMVLEQDKHSIRAVAQPFGDRSHGLRNTLATWIEAVDCGNRLVDTTSFLMVTNGAVPECIARRIARAMSEGGNKKKSLKHDYGVPLTRCGCSPEIARRSGMLCYDSAVLALFLKMTIGKEHYVDLVDGEFKGTYASDLTDLFARLDGSPQKDHLVVVAERATVFIGIEGYSITSEIPNACDL
jgi:hypothetical protein